MSLETRLVALVQAIGADVKALLAAVRAGLVRAGTAAEPSVRQESDTNTGLNLPGADVLQLVTGGQVRLSIDAAGNLSGTTATTTAPGLMSADDKKFVGAHHGQYLGPSHVRDIDNLPDGWFGLFSTQATNLSGTPPHDTFGAVWLHQRSIYSGRSVQIAYDYAGSTASTGRSWQRIKGGSGWGPWFMHVTDTFRHPLTITNNTASTSRSTGALVVVGGVGISGAVHATDVHNSTTAEAPNVHVDSAGRLRRSTSAARYKRDVQDADGSAMQRVIDMARPVWYRSNCEADCPEHSYWGLIAEELAAIDPRFVHWAPPEDEPEAEPVPAGVAYDRLVVPLLWHAKQLQARLDALEARLPPAHEPTPETTPET